MLRSDRLLALLALSGLALASGCAGPPIPGTIEGVPVCGDFDLGRTRMEGTLRHPVRVRVLEGKAILFKTVLSGLRHPGDPKPRTLIVDDNGDYSVEWAQCANERAPRSVADAAHETGKARDKKREPETGYDCGEPTVYKTEKLLTKKGDRASHTITFAVPPDATCWQGDAAPTKSSASPTPPAPPPAVALDGGTHAAPAAGAAADAGAK